MNQQQFYQNQFLQNYRNFQQNNVPFQNNALLSNNPMFQSNVNYNGSQQTKKMQMMQMQKLKQIEKIKALDKITEINKMYNKDKLKEAVIAPIKIQKKVGANPDVKKKADEYEKTKDGEREKYWKSRTNEPYKNIIKDADYKKPVSKTDDLIVHKVTPADKLGVDEKFTDFEKDKKQHDDDLKVIYSANEKTKHLKQFEYQHKYKYRIRHNPSDHEELKSDNVEYYKNEQKKLEKDKKKLDVILESLVGKEMISDQELKETEDKLDDLSTADVAKLESQLKAELGEDYEKLQKEVETEISNVVQNNDVDNNDISDDDDDKESPKNTASIAPTPPPTKGLIKPPPSVPSKGLINNAPTKGLVSKSSTANTASVKRPVAKPTFTPQTTTTQPQLTQPVKKPVTAIVQKKPIAQPMVPNQPLIPKSTNNLRHSVGTKCVVKK